MNVSDITLNIFKIYWFNNESQSFDTSCESATINANNELDALKKWYIHINGYYSNASWFVKQTYTAIRY